MRRHFAIVLLFGVLAMNMDMVCQSLCLAGHGDMTHAHASHKTTNHEMPKADMCPVKHNHSQESHHDMPQSSIKCDCSADQAASVGFEFTSANAALHVTPYLRMVSTIQPQNIIFLSNEPAPLEGPPKLIS
ncbi:MAG: hypothetical protein HZB81_05130 [Deltaproteobacteria bacterium]|nr:hypothetical protein [Deltaproteobacteria bacterium]